MSKEARPILFNTDMVTAIIEGRKTQTRRVNKDKQLEGILNSPFKKENPEITDRQIIEALSIPQYEAGDILYVRECWSIDPSGDYIFKADYVEPTTEDKNTDYLGNRIKWHPSIHMPKEAARIFLKVNNLWAEKLQDITIENIEREGIKCPTAYDRDIIDYIADFARLWDSTIKNNETSRYGWNANPWVWVYAFERIEKSGEF